MYYNPSAFGLSTFAKYVDGEECHGLLSSARPEMVIFPNLFVGRKKLRTFIYLR